ncbi:ankyrin repeat domain-containing protein [Burkholderia sp. S171]|uniref:ankyrin repeat domain-containing protein n=1 Tax=Burkholderia sp. S171 TaxID=1641860 RepID=UPI00131AC731|nr:ankyrin repeat domain-containing protein [Burkholderia sp. S171]
MIEFHFAESQVPHTPAKRLFDAARTGDILRLEQLCASEGLESRDVFERGESLLFPAAASQKTEMCEWLLDNGVRAEHQDHSGRTALLSAIVFRDAGWNQKLITLLSRAINIADRSGVTPLMQATKGAGAFGAKRGNLKIVKALVENGADVFAQDDRGLTPLGRAEFAARKSKQDVNDEIIAFLKNTMVEAAAMHEFLRLYQHHFSPKGVLMIQHRPS